MCGGEIIVGFAMWLRARQQPAQRDDARDAVQDPEHCDVGQTIRQILQNCRFVLSPLADRSFLKKNLRQFAAPFLQEKEKNFTQGQGPAQGPSAPFSNGIMFISFYIGLR